MLIGEAGRRLPHNCRVPGAGLAAFPRCHWGALILRISLGQNRRSAYWIVWAIALKFSARQMEETAMLDIGKFIRYDRLDANDPEGNLFDLDSWTPKKALQLAEKEGIVLTDEHWEVITSLREGYRKHGGTMSARDIARELEDEFSGGQGRRSLYELFPGGPVTQGCRIAGLPMPPGSVDASFGSVM
jgi:tRNA 2-thiouridine synthesizing protein E